MSETVLESVGWPSPAELAVRTLGQCRHSAPVRGEAPVDERNRVVLPVRLLDLAPFLTAGREPPSFEPAGPRAQIFFDPGRLTCGIVTCGGLCPGLNNVIRSIVLRLTYAYGVRRILGFRYGYAGLARGQEPNEFTVDDVEHVQERGGTMLGTSRGPQDVADMVDTLVRLDVGLLFVLGGDGGLRGAWALSDEIARRGLAIGVVGIPKTIDNDLQWTAQSFGFATAVDAARAVVGAAHTEARAAWNGIGLVKLMGRESGFIAVHATLASGDVNFCLVPEVPWRLDGEGGFLDVLARRLDAKRHAVVVVAEGAGQDLLRDGRPPERDASGNLKLQDIGTFLRDGVARHFAARRTTVNLRYFDPSYLIRSQPAASIDAEYCLVLGQHAVHAGMAGRTNVMVGVWNGRYVHVPIPLAVASCRKVDPRGEDWQRVLESTGQPATMGPG